MPPAVHDKSFIPLLDTARQEYFGKYMADRDKESQTGGREEFSWQKYSVIETSSLPILTGKHARPARSEAPFLLLHGTTFDDQTPPCR